MHKTKQTLYKKFSFRCSKLTRLICQILLLKSLKDYPMSL